MGIKKSLVTNEDGTSSIRYESAGHVVFTGPISGTVELSSGKKVNVTDAFVEADTAEEAMEIAEAIGRRHASDGHPSFLADPLVPDDGFIHIPKEA